MPLKIEKADYNYCLFSLTHCLAQGQKSFAFCLTELADSIGTSVINYFPGPIFYAASLLGDLE